MICPICKEDEAKCLHDPRMIRLVRNLKKEITMLKKKLEKKQ